VGPTKSCVTGSVSPVRIVVPMQTALAEKAVIAVVVLVPKAKKIAMASVEIVVATAIAHKGKVVSLEVVLVLWDSEPVKESASTMPAVAQTVTVKVARLAKVTVALVPKAKKIAMVSVFPIISAVQIRIVPQVSVVLRGPVLVPLVKSSAMESASNRTSVARMPTVLVVRLVRQASASVRPTKKLVMESANNAVRIRIVRVESFALLVLASAPVD